MQFPCVHELKRIEAERAIRRQIKLAGTRPSEDLRETLTKGGKDKASDIAAAKVGLSGRTAEQAEKVIDKINETAAPGDQVSGDQLRTRVNRKEGL